MTPDAAIPYTPLPPGNRPGLSAIAYRVGTQASFRLTMLDRMAGLQGLHTHEAGDVTVALLDAVATMAEVLSFYQERIANESYLRTATERRSVLELARLIDYRPRPGVAASAFLAFTLEDAPGAPGLATPPITVAAGLRVQSLPGPGEQPRSFETSADLSARPEWNAIRVRSTQEQPISTDMASVRLRGVALNIAAGDLLLIAEAADERAAARVVSVSVDTASGTTRLDLTEDPPDPPDRLRRFKVGVFRPSLFLQPGLLTDEVVTSDIFGFGWRQHDLAALVRIQNWRVRALVANFRHRVAHRKLPPEVGVFAFRQKAAVFGNNAPRFRSLPDAQRGPNGAYPVDWDDPARTLADESGVRQVDLDRPYGGIAVGSAVVLESETNRRAYRVQEVRELSRADYGLSAKVTRLRLDSDDGFDTFTVRGTTVYLQSERLAVADLPIQSPVAGSEVVLDSVYFGLEIGQTVILSGTRSDLEGAAASEALVIADLMVGAGYTTLRFRQALQNAYVRDSVTINANVALATHGETVGEILGSGDAGRAFQTVPLRQPPLTYVSAANPSGAQSTLEVRVNGLAWGEVPCFLGRGPNDRVYVSRTGDDGTTSVTFGDGLTGARPPSGVENISARYRKGMGVAGNVDAGRIMLLPVRPIGVRGVTNPLPADGATGPETRDEIRRNAALTMLTLDRIVSLQDYEDFARAFAGVAKAMASWSWLGRTRGVFVTVAGAGGAVLDTGSPTFLNLLAAMRKAGDPQVPLRVQSYRRAFFRVGATVTVEPGWETGTVLAGVEAALRGAFGFDARAFGQPVALSAVIGTIQGAPGVRAVEVRTFGRTDDPGEGVAASILAAAAPVPGSEGAPLAAELLTLDPRPLDLAGAAA